MTFEAYIEHFEDILNSKNPLAPYDNQDYLDYTKLNWSRMNRWLKNGIINTELKSKIEGISENQSWILITEPWCGDAAHSVPFIKMISDLNPKIKLDIQLRDTDSEIDSYLTNGGKSIPKLIIRNEAGKDLAIWGPRPEKCQVVFQELKEKNADFDELKIALQNWYNENKGVDIQLELFNLL